MPFALYWTECKNGSYQSCKIIIDLIQLLASMSLSPVILLNKKKTTKIYSVVASKDREIHFLMNNPVTDRNSG